LPFSRKLYSLNTSFEEVCMKLAAFRKGKNLSLVGDQDLEFDEVEPIKN
jgi:hypothetical protein